MEDIGIKPPFSSSFEHCRRFSRSAMATVFEMWIVEKDAIYAEQAARAAFEELERLENELSHFIPTSDIARINHLKPGERIVVGLDAFRCLKECIELQQETFGIFDISIGDFKDDPGSYTPLTRSPLENIKLDERNKTVELLEGRLNLDLGGYGKGYALDVMTALLRDWDIPVALLHGGRSSVLALDAPEGMEGWPVTISHPITQNILKSFHLQNSALSGSGLQKGKHIVDPRTGQPATHILAAWARTSSAAQSDAISTALMVMSEEERARFLGKHSDMEVMLERQ